MLFLEVEQLAQTGILLNGGLAVTSLLLSLGQRLTQALVLGLELVVFVDIAVNALEPFGHGAYYPLHGCFHRSRHVLHKAGFALQQIGTEAGDECDDQNYRSYLYSVFLKIPFYIHNRRTPICLSI